MPSSRMCWNRLSKPIEIAFVIGLIFCNEGTVKILMNGLQKYKVDKELNEQLKNTSIDTLNLSTRSYNVLRRNHIENLYELFSIEFEDIRTLKGLGNLYIHEINNAMSRYIGEGNTGNAKYSITTLDHDPRKYDLSLLTKYFQKHDFAIRELEISRKTHNVLLRAGIVKASQLVSISIDGIMGLRGVGEKTFREIVDIKNRIEKPISDMIKSGELSEADIDIRTFQEVENIVNEIFGLSDKGIFMEDILKQFNSKIEQDFAKQIILNNINNSIYEVINGYCYRHIPSFLEVVGCVEDERQKEILIYRCQGRSLEEISKDYNLTREGVRQIQEKGIRNVKLILRDRYNLNEYKEDKYKKVFTEYYFEKKIWNECFPEDSNVFNVLCLFYKRGNLLFSNAIQDITLDIDIREKIQKFNEKNTIILNNTRVGKNRSDIEDYVIKNYCIENTKLSEYIAMINHIIIEVNASRDNSNQIDLVLEKSQGNKLALKRNILWKPGCEFRYYDIDSRDYSDLLDTLSLDEYHNVDYSAFKFFNMYPDIMKYYDIRDGYELHNLLKKLEIDINNPHIVFGRNPTISFDEFDRGKAAYEMMSKLSPVSRNDLAAALSEEYGYSSDTILANTWLSDLDVYSNKDGVYTIDSPSMPEVHMQKLRELLPDTFYRITEIKKIYVNNIEDADPNLVSHFNLKRMGYLVNSTYAIKGYDSARQYFTHLLIDADTVDITPYLKKFAGITDFSALLASLKDSYTIIEFEPNHYITLKKLGQIGITKNIIKQFCDEVNRFANDEIFTLRKLVGDGFVNSLDYLGFSDWFYSSLLREDDRFIYAKYANQILFRKKTSNKSTFRKTLIQDILLSEKKISIDDILLIIKNKYGLESEKQDIYDAIKDTEMYFDPIMETLYVNYDLYYEEI